MKRTAHVLITIVLTILSVAQLTHGQSTQPSTAPSIAPGAGAQAYFDQTLRILNTLEQDLPAISASATEAASLYVQSGAPGLRIGIAGERVFISELAGRSGGMMRLEDIRVPKDQDFKGIVLYGLRGNRDMAEDVFWINYHRKLGSKIAVFGRTTLLKRAREMKAEFDWAIDTHSLSTGGLIPGSNNRWLVSTDEIAQVIAGWAWTAEFVAACTREGKMPPMYKGFLFAGGAERAKKIGDVKFHDEAPTPMPALQAGQTFFSELRKSLTAIHEHEFPDILKLADVAIEARNAHKGVYIFAQNHATMWAFDGPHEANVFTRIGYWKSQRRDLELAQGDLVFAHGYVGIWEGADWNDYAGKARAAGARIVWSLGADSARTYQLPEGEWMIDQHFADPDAVIQFPGYDIKVIPVSGVGELMIYHMTCAQVISKRAEHSLVKK